MSDLSERIAAFSPEKRAQLEKLITESPGQFNVFPLSFAQKRMWFIDQLQPETPLYTIPAALRLTGSLHTDILQQSFRRIIERHEALRTTFIDINGAPFQMIASASEFVLQQIDLSELPPEQRKQEATRQLIEEARRAFDLEKGPLIRATLWHLDQEEHILLVAFHHIIADAWSLGIFVRELGILYESMLNEEDEQLSVLPIQYADYAHWQQQWLQNNYLDQQFAYWREQLGGYSDNVLLPYDHPRSVQPTYQGKILTTTLPNAVVGDLQALSQSNGVTLFMTLLAAFNVLIYRYSNQDDIALGTPIAGRTLQEVENLIGFFVNTLVIRISVSEKLTFRSLLARVKETTLGAYAHQDVPFDLLVKELQPEREAGQSPFFRIMFALENAPIPSIELSGLHIQVMDVDSGVAKFDLTVIAQEDLDGLKLQWEYNVELFEEETIGRLSRHFAALIASIIAQPDALIAQLRFLSDDEKAYLITNNTVTQREISYEKGVHQFVETQAARVPDALASSCGDEALSYQELNLRANQLAHYLRALNITSESRIGICIDRSLDLLVGILGILKAGAAYVPIDPAYPRDRLAYMIEDAQIEILLTHESLALHLTGLGAELHLLDRDWPQIADFSAANLDAIVYPDQLAYLIYTSGSTGQPKASQITHRSLMNLVTWHQHSFAVTAQDRATQIAGIGFDAAVWEIWPYLTCGASIHFPGEEIRIDPERLRDWLIAQKITISFVPTPLAEVLLQLSWPSDVELRTLLTGGDRLHIFPPSDLPFTLVNNYGPTEATVVATSTIIHPQGEKSGRLPSIGQPIQNTRVYVLDQYMQPVPIGVPGELFIGGVGVARGYLHRPDLTAEKFIPDPFSDQPGARLYRTGDLVRLLSDGSLDFIGRVDFQVKIRGYRIELGEIEAVLAQYPGIVEAVVIAQKDAQDILRLVAFLVPASQIADTINADHGESDRFARDLKSYVQTKLPEYMIPGAFVFIESIPLTPNGKVDQHALPIVESYNYHQGDSYVAPDTDKERRMADIWRDVLKIDRVGVYDNFFDIGGHSLLAVRLVSRVREHYGDDIPLRLIFEHPTIASLVDALNATNIQGASAAAIPSLSRVPSQYYADRYILPASFGQQRLWFLDQMDPGNAAYNISAALTIKGDLHIEALRQSINMVVQRHEVLRSTFIQGSPEEGGEILALVEPAIEIPLPIIDLRDISEDARDDVIRQHAQAESNAPFDIAIAPLMRTVLLRIEDTQYLLLLTLHHSVADGWSMSILAREIIGNYTLLSQPSVEHLQASALPIQYADYAGWQRDWLRGDIQEQQLAYWRAQLKDISGPIALPTDYPREPFQSFAGARQTLIISEVFAAKIKQLGQREHATLFMTLLAALQVLLHRVSRQDDIAVGVPIAIRNRPELEDLIGFFLNTLLLHDNIADSQSFAELLQNARAMTLDAFSNQDVPFEKVVAEIQPGRDLGYQPLFNVMLNMLNFEFPDLTMPGIDIELSELAEPEAKFDLTFYASEEQGTIRLDLVYNSHLFEHIRMVELLDQFQGILSQVVEQPEISISTLSLVTPRSQVLLPDPSQPLTYNMSESLLSRISLQASKAPGHIALVDRSTQWSYEELDRASNQLARFWQAHQVGREDIVAVYGHRSASLVWSLLGILKAGAAFLILDPAYPPERLVNLLQAARPKGWICLEAAGEPPMEVTTFIEATIPAARITLPVHPDSDTSLLLQQYPADSLDTIIQPHDLAQVTFTSGTTGNPKGILTEHGSLSHFFHWYETTFTVGPQDRFSMLSGLAHDPLMRDIFAPLWIGATLYIPDPDEFFQPGMLTDWLKENRISVMHLTPALSHLLAVLGSPGEDVPILDSLSYAFFGGDRLKHNDLARLQSLAPQATYVNFYGATETPQAMGYHIVDLFTPNNVQIAEADDFSSENIPIGQGIADVQLLVLNAASGQSGIGEIGEICVRTPYLARGYLNDIDLTSERFIQNPFTFDPQDRIYRTGDLGRISLTGSIEFIGRYDNQIKIRGYRVELSEIESALRGYPAISDVVVEPYFDDINTCLAAYIVLDPEQTIPTSQDIFRYMQTKVPDYMVPASIAFLESLPLTANGKIDRRALANIAKIEDVEDYVVPQTANQEILVGIWSDLLNIHASHISIHANFFELGGHSLLATQLLARIRAAFGVELPLRSLFESATIERMAALIESLEQKDNDRSLPSIPRVSHDGALPLSFAQQRLWLLDQLKFGTQAYTIPAIIRARGKIELAALQQSFDSLIERQEMLRTTFTQMDGQPWQSIAAPFPIRIDTVDLSSIPEEQRDISAHEMIFKEIAKPFDLAQGPLLRVMVYRLASNDHILLITLHHIIADGWSIGILIQDLASFYAAFSSGLPSPRISLPLQYADYAVWQRQWLSEERLQHQLTYWRERLSNAPTALDLPLDHPRPPVQTFAGATYPFQASPRLVQQVAQLSKQAEATVFMTLLAAFSVLLARLANQEDLVIGTPIANRPRSELEGLIGFFSNTLVMRVDATGNPTFLDLLGRVREVCLGAYTHQDVPFEKLVEEIRPERDLSRNPLFQAMFVLQNTPMPSINFPELHFEAVPIDNQTSKFDIMFVLTMTSTGLKGTIEYNTDLYDEKTIARMVQQYTVLLESIVAAPTQNINFLPMLSSSERTKIIDEWNVNEVDYSPEVCLHHLVEEQVERNPGAIAVIYDAPPSGDRHDEAPSLTYEELDRRANQLAHRLVQLGVRPDSIVGICAERSLEMVIGALGVLKAGAAYLPLDPEAPVQRISYILHDAKIVVTLSQERFRASLPSDMAVVSLDEGDWYNESQERLNVPVSPDNLAYVIYTSGSTGEPKGASIEHRAISNNLLWMQENWPIGPGDHVLQKTPFTFDVSVKEIFWPLLAGAQVVMAQPGGHRDPEYLRQVIARREITVTHFVPSMLQLFLAGKQGAEGEHLRLVMCGAETLPVGLQDQFFQSLSADLLHLYGPTEAAIAVTGLLCERGVKYERVPLGRAMPYCQLYVLDKYLQPVPIGVPGELYIGGFPLARGYLDRPEETASKFVPNPFGNQPGSRLYRTGDLARYRDDGMLEYLGRIDFQIKLRGLRIELGEIEAVIRRHPDVRDAVAVVREDEPGDKRLVCYITPNSEHILAPQELREYLEDRLPAYMIPATFMMIDAMPLNAHGKVDRMALPSPLFERPELDTDFVAPRTETEERIAAIWREILGIDVVGIQDNFFKLGGHSLMAVQVMSRINTLFHMDLPLRDFFESPTIEGIAGVVERTDPPPEIEEMSIRSVSRDAYRRKIQ
jgi:amino acid adenylation domain-containing protein